MKFYLYLIITGMAFVILCQSLFINRMSRDNDALFSIGVELVRELDRIGGGK